MLKGKGGRFRQNLLGKRVDYSAARDCHRSRAQAESVRAPRRWRWFFFDRHHSSAERSRVRPHSTQREKMIERQTPESGTFLTK